MMCRDLPEVGVVLLPSSHAENRRALEAMLSRRLFFTPWPDPVPEPAAILCNNSGRRIIGFSFVWTFVEAGGRKPAFRMMNVGSSSSQLDMLTGNDPGEHFNYIAAGSRRLLTPGQMHGDNFDVLPPPARGGGFSGAGGGARDTDERALESVTLDFVILDDGLFAGPDESGHFEMLVEELDRIHDVSAAAVELLQEGKTAGAVFDLLHSHMDRQPPSLRVPHVTRSVLPMFAQWSAGQLGRLSREDLILWFARYAQPGKFHLRRV
ncbi:MAG: hypothetical protein HY820_37385 [Acidobacteria bacterium]|nr:hypothetical protein [Acidobacteriota bacterium]